MWRLTLLLLCAGTLLGFTHGRDIIKRDAEDVTCTGKFQELPGHTMCLQDHPGVEDSGLTEEDKKTILRLHNYHRANVDPPATDLATLVWDDGLAAIAQKWAKQCVLGHDKNREQPGMALSVGQNVAAGQASWEEAVNSWHSEVNDYQFGLDPDSYLGSGGWLSIAHYTQMVQNTTRLVGCGFASCANTDYTRYFVCNYASLQLRLGEPYTRGDRCSVCPENCEDGLCQCGLACQNEGYLDLNKCICICPDLYKGKECEKINCPDEDKSHCGSEPFVPSNCGVYYNVPTDCPHLCGLCDEKDLHQVRFRKGPLSVTDDSFTTEQEETSEQYYTETYQLTDDSFTTEQEETSEQYYTETYQLTDDSFTTEQEETSEQYYTETYQPVTDEYETPEWDMSTEGADFTTDMSSVTDEYETPEWDFSTEGADFTTDMSSVTDEYETPEWDMSTEYPDITTDMSPVTEEFETTEGPDFTSDFTSDMYDSFTTEQVMTSEEFYTETEGPSCRKVCENGGTLDSYSCTCQCVQPFSGDTCRRNGTCRDYADGCHAWTDSCDKDHIREKHCPLTCGLCSQVEEHSCRDIIPTCSDNDCSSKKRKTRLCPLTCGVCPSPLSDKATCEDVLPTCSYPGTVEYCYTPVMKHVLCRHTCGGCDDYAECSDTQTDCAIHKSYYCSEGYFKYVSCRATCGVCTATEA
ncbi:uncharacterized protein LOC143287163 [Babylonia areolata]|uniref:uncharacterized protein LOC143287163 n=1 Tax=Babylonia areolata TaxID=304850 RepID=UPI003FD5524D